MGDKLSDISTLPSPILPTYHLPPIVFRNWNFQAGYSDMASTVEVGNIFTSDEYLDLMGKKQMQGIETRGSVGTLTVAIKQGRRVWFSHGNAAG